MNKMICLVLCSLFIMGGNAGFVASTEPEDNTVIYVDDDNTQGPWYGTLEHPFQLIQDAVDEATTGDTVFVYNGIYYEQISINKTIKLSGENQNDTVINGENIWSGSLIIILADYVTLKNLTIMNCKNIIGSGLKLKANDCIIENCIITKNRGHGVQIYNSSSNKVKYNFIECNDECGIDIVESSLNNISFNQIINNTEDFGIFIRTSNNNTFFRNKIENNCVGINVRYSTNNIFHKNLINNNSGIGIWFGSCTKNDIMDNDLSKNKEQNILVEYSTNNAVKNNKCTSAGETGIAIHFSSEIMVESNIISNSQNFSIALAKSENNSILNNSIINNKGWGIILHDADYNHIKVNNITKNVEDGIQLEEQSNNNEISNNEIGKNDGCGIILKESSFNNIYDNVFLFNGINAFFINCQNRWFDNYWNYPRILPYPIIGIKYLNCFKIPWFTFDIDPK